MPGLAYRITDRLEAKDTKQREVLIAPSGYHSNGGHQITDNMQDAANERGTRNPTVRVAATLLTAIPRHISVSIFIAPIDLERIVTVVFFVASVCK